MNPMVEPDRCKYKIECLVDRKPPLLAANHNQPPPLSKLPHFSMDYFEQQQQQQQVNLQAAKVQITAEDLKSCGEEFKGPPKETDLKIPSPVERCKSLDSDEGEFDNIHSLLYFRVNPYLKPSSQDQNLKKFRKQKFLQERTVERCFSKHEETPFLNSLIM